MKRTSIFIDETVDKAAIKKIRQQYGLSTDSDAIRLAIRVLAASDALQIDLETWLDRQPPAS